MNVATVVYILIGLLGFGLLVGGVLVLFGAGWALLAGAASCFCVAGFMRKGLTGE
jgi:hypothetical protein